MKKLRTALAASLAILTLAGAAAGCAGQGSSGGNNNISAWVGSSPETIDPNMNSSMDGSTYIVHLDQGLFRFKWDGTGVENGDAESNTISDDGLVWTFKIRKNAKWSDGKPVTAQDYEYTWKRVCDPSVAAPYGEDMAVFLQNGLRALEGEVSIDEVGVKALDDSTFEVHLDGPCPFFDQIAAFPVFYPVRRDMIEANGDSWWTNPATYITNGAYKMKSFTLDESLVLEKNPNFYDKSKVVADTITWKFLADETAALTALRAGEIDIANNAPPEEAATLKAEGILDVRPQIGTYYICFNNDKAPFDNPLVRKAFSLAADRDYLANTIMQGTRIPATAMVGPGFADIDLSKDFRDVGGEFISLDYEKNKELARQALADAGYPNGEGFPTVEYMYNTSSGHQLIGEALAKAWEEVLGIKTELAVQEWGVFLDTRRKGNYQIARNGWISDWMDPSSMLTIFQTGGGNNDSNYSNPQFDSYMNESYSTNDRTARITALHNAEKVLMDDWGCAPLMFYRQSYIVSKSLKDWHDISLGYTFLHLAHK